MIPLPDVALGSDEPLYNIGVVARMTGVSMATLRAWERRYNFPESERTAGGHRLYSERDVLRLRWVKQRIDEGMQTAQAINALRHQEKTGNLALIEPLHTFAEHARDETIAKTTAHLPKIQAELVAALTHRNLQRADNLLGEALALSSPEDLILNVISPTLSQIGEAWEDGQINIATEHLATNYLRQRLLMWMVSGPPPREINPILLACAPNEWHEGSLLVLGALLRRRRWPVAYLGQAMPLPDLANIVRELHPSMLVMVAMTENSAAELSDWPQWLPEAAQSGKPPAGYGGRIYAQQPEWRLRMAGIYLGDTFQEGIVNIERLLEGRTHS
ncbi:MAG: MerR family transcriptional regulator [Anaerolineales bacterium]|nr:MerR family transcriptional regulator [Anaerolineales bacterium]